MHNCSGERMFTDFHIFIRLYLTLSVALLGILANVANATVFLSRRMRCHPINWFLLALSLSDICLLICNILFVSLPVIAEVVGERWLLLTETYVYFVIFAYPVGIMAQTASVYYTTLVCLHRYIGICHPLRARRWATKRSVKIAIMAAAVFSILLNTSRWLEVGLQPCIAQHYGGRELKQNLCRFQTERAEETTKGYVDLFTSTVYAMVLRWWCLPLFPFISLTKLSVNEAYRVGYGTIGYTLVMFVAPFLVLMVVNTLMIRAVYRSKKLRKKHTLVSASTSSFSGGGGSRIGRSLTALNRTTRLRIGDEEEQSLCQQRQTPSLHRHWDDRMTSPPEQLRISVARRFEKNSAGSTPSKGSLYRNRRQAESDGPKGSLPLLANKHLSVDHALRRESALPFNTTSPSLQALPFAHTRTAGRLKEARQTEGRVTTMLLMIVAVFLLCNSLPFVNNILEIVMTYYSQLRTTDLQGLFEVSVEVGNLLVAFNSASTIVIYLLFSSKYGKEFTSTFCCRSEARGGATTIGRSGTLVYRMMSTVAGAASPKNSLLRSTLNSNFERNHIEETKL